MAGTILALLSACLVALAVRSSPAHASLPGPYSASTLFRADGTLASAPATVTLPDLGPAAFVLGADGNIYWSTQTIPWSGLGAPPGGAVNDPSVVSWGPGRIDLFVEGHDQKLWQRFTTCSGCQWSNWLQPVGTDGVLASAPVATSWSPGRIDIVVLGTDSRFYWRDWDTNAWSGGWVSLGTPAVAPTAGEHPAITSSGPGRLDVYYRGRDNKLSQAFMLNGAWTDWFQPPGTEAGTLSAAPAASSWNGGPLGGHVRETVFVQGSDHHLYQTTYDGGWSPWAVQGAPDNFLQGAPEVPTTLVSMPYVLTWGTDNKCYGYFPTSQLALRAPIAASYAAGRSGFASFTIIDTATQSLYASAGANSQVGTASVVKVPIAMALMRLVAAQHRGLTASEASLLHLMITQSDNNAATTLWNEVGGSTAVVGLMRSLGATNTVANPGSPEAWAFTRSTSHDMATVLAQLAEGVLGPSATATILNEMHQVIPSQTWGIDAALPGSAVKNGWYPDPGDWRINCLGIIAGTRYALAIMTQYPSGLGKGYGEITCQQIAADLFPSGANVAAVRLPAGAAQAVPAITGFGLTSDGG